MMNYEYQKWRNEIEMLGFTITKAQSEKFLNLIAYSERLIQNLPIETGMVLFAIFSSRYDHGMFESVYNVLQKLDVYKYYKCLIASLEKLLINDPNDHWVTHLLTYPTRDLTERDYLEIKKAFDTSTDKNRDLFIEFLNKTDNKTSISILSKSVLK